MAKYSLKRTPTGVMLVRGSAHYGEVDSVFFDSTYGFKSVLGGGDLPEVVGTPDESSIDKSIVVDLKLGKTEASVTVLKGYVNSVADGSKKEDKGVKGSDSKSEESQLVDEASKEVEGSEVADSKLGDSSDVAQVVKEDVAVLEATSEKVQNDPLAEAEAQASAELAKAVSKGSADAASDVVSDKESVVRASTAEEVLSDRRSSIPVGTQSLQDIIAERRRGSYSSAPPLSLIIRRRISGLK